MITAPRPRAASTPGRDGDLLAEIARKGEGAQPLVVAVQLAQGLQRRVAGAVVDEQDLKTLHTFQRRDEPGDEAGAGSRIR